MSSGRAASILFDFSEVNVGLPEGSRFPDGQVFMAADVDEETVLAQFQARGVRDRAAHRHQDAV
jgi:hypothetical protein